MMLAERQPQQDHHPLGLDPRPLGFATGSAFGVRLNLVMGLSFPPPEPNKLLLPHRLDALRTKHNRIPSRSPLLRSSLPRANTHHRRAGTRGGHPFQAHALISSPNKLKL